tara:strand:+ start:185 stop:385 length:201 start_codon:yes stop_codon:yes gene_type:complete
MKAKLIGVFNGLVWSFIFYVIIATFASVVSWSNRFSVADWDTAGRGFALIIIMMIFAACIPFKGVK